MSADTEAAAIAANLALNRSWSVFPCRNDKRPACPHGFKDAVSEPGAVADLWRRFPGPLIGVATGLMSGLFVLDLDIKHAAALHWWQINEPSCRRPGPSGPAAVVFTSTSAMHRGLAAAPASWLRASIRGGTAAMSLRGSRQGSNASTTRRPRLYLPGSSARCCRNRTRRNSARHATTATGRLTAPSGRSLPRRKGNANSSTLGGLPSRRACQGRAARRRRGRDAPSRRSRLRGPEPTGGACHGALRPWENNMTEEWHPPADRRNWLPPPTDYQEAHRWKNGKPQRNGNGHDKGC